MVAVGAASPADRVTRLQRVARALAQASSVDAVATVAVDAGLAEAGSAVGGLWLPEGDALVAVHVLWADPDQPERLRRFPITANMPASEAYRTGVAVWVADPGASRARYPGLRPPPQGYFALPLIGTSGVLGVLAGRHNVGAGRCGDDRTFLATIADLCAQALERTQAYEHERRAKQALEFLAEATEVMISAEEPREVLQHLVRLAVPRLAPWCAVYVAEGARLRRAADAASFVLGAERPGAYEPLNRDTPVTRVFRTGVTEVVEIDEALLRANVSERVAARLVSVGLTASLIVPVRLGDDTLGVLALGLEDDSDEFRFAATGLAARAAIALANARRHRHQHDLVRSLTEALLPAQLPSVDGYDLAARYVPSSGGVCGDWYEVEPAPDGTVWFGVGDASGHGIAAASTMALARNAALGIRETEHEPAHVLSILSRVVEHHRRSDIVTAVHGVLEPGTGHVRWASAGHPHGIVLSADGTVEELSGVHGPPLGVRYEHETNRHRLEPGDALVWYTDGVIERRGENLGFGIKRLLDVIAASDATTADDVGEQIVTELCNNPDDDCCVLIIRRLTAT